MLSEREQELIHKYSEEIRESYLGGSRLPLLTTVRRERDVQAPNFIKIGKRFRIPRELFEEGHIIIMRPFSNFVELSEYQYLIDSLKQTSTRRTQGNTLNTEIIDQAISSISSLIPPNFIIIPIAFYVDLHQMSRNSRSPIIQYEDGQSYYCHRNIRLRVLWSNKFINLNEIIIGNSYDSEWRFKSADGENRLTVEFYSDETPMNIILLIQTVFKFLTPPADRVAVIEFPENLCNLE